MDIVLQDTIIKNFMGEIARAILDAGVSTPSYGTIIHLDDASQGDIDTANALLSGYGQMAIATDKSSITADDTEIATITVTAEPGDTQIRFDVWDSEDDHAIENEVVAVSGGEAQYQFKTALAETYQIFAYGDVSHQSGQVEVIANAS